ncbi:hypothetical protein [Acidovorax sp.]|uniref:hypothetical protein n=1 Tax=Acidovorax sp. TaxID=1872122 RepID=UPI00391C5F40
MTMPRKVHTTESLLARVDEFGDCLIWNGYMANNTPYVFHEGKMTSVRGLLWKLSGKKVPDEKVYYRAICQQDGCVNPAHIRCDTEADHMKRLAQPELRTAAGEAIRAAKISQHKRKLSRITEETIQEILHSNETGPEIERRLGISRSLVSQYRRGRLGATRASNPFQGLGAR